MSEEFEFDIIPDGELTKWEKEGKVVAGLLKTRTYKKDTGKGEGYVYEVKTARGIEAFFAPSLLQKKLAEVPLMSVVKITYEKQSRTSNGNTLKHFQVGSITPDHPQYNIALEKVGLKPSAPVAPLSDIETDPLNGVGTVAGETDVSKIPF